jgi:hypothetical protein
MAAWRGSLHRQAGILLERSMDEQYDILTFEGYVRWGAGACQSTCYPAWF